MTTPEPLPCQFCKMGARLSLSTEENMDACYVICLSCFSQGPPLKGKKEAIEAWNERA